MRWLRLVPWRKPDVDVTRDDCAELERRFPELAESEAADRLIRRVHDEALRLDISPRWALHSIRFIEAVHLLMLVEFEYASREP